MHSRAVRPTRSGVTGTSRQARTRRPSLGGDLLDAGLGRGALVGVVGQVGHADGVRARRAAGRHPGRRGRSASGTWVRMPAPSPTSGSAPVAPRWSRLRSASRAWTTMSWPAVPRIVATRATPQASCSCSRRYRPVSAGWAEKRATVTSHHRPRGRRPLRDRARQGQARTALATSRKDIAGPSSSCHLSRRYPTSWDSGSLHRDGSSRPGAGGR